MRPGIEAVRCRARPPYTGHGDLWKNSEWPTLSPEEKAERRAKFTAGEPGFGHSACE